MAQSSVTVVSGFSGVGKGTMVKALRTRYPEQYWLSVSVTTREPREGEVDGVDYSFITQDAYDRMVENDGLLEHAEYTDASYGTPGGPVLEQLDSGRDVLLEIETKGGQSVRRRIKDTILIFVMTPSAAILEQRLRDRHTETEVRIQKRLARAIDECREISKYDAIIINDDLERAGRELHRVIQELKRNPDSDDVIRPADKVEFIAQFRKDLVGIMERLYPMGTERPEHIRAAINRYYEELAHLR